jgi:hypothetical protein
MLTAKYKQSYCKKIFIIILMLCLTFLASGCFATNFVKKYGTNITEYTLNLKLEDKKTLTGTQVVNYKNTTSNILGEVYFHLYPNSFSDVAVNKPVSKLYETKAYPNGFSYGKIQVNDVNIDNNDCSYSLENVDNDLLKVTLNAPLYPNDFVSINFDYKVTIPNVLHRFGWNDKTINLGNFYPIACVFDANGWDKNPYSSNGDPFYSNLANYNVTITYPKTYTLANSGVKTQTQQDSTGETITTKMTANAVRDFAMVLSNVFETKSQIVDNTEITYYYYGDTRSDESLDVAKKALVTFNEKYGKYPYSTLAVVETGFLYGGMEYPNLVMISDSLEKYDDYQITIIHEIAHQWWYGVVGNNEYDYGWLDESLAEYSVVVFYENNPEYEIKREVCVANAITSYTLFVDVYKDVFKEVDTSMNRKLNQYDTEPEYVYAAYVKGMIMFDDIRNLIGDKSFFDSLKNYYKKMGGQNATPNNLIQIFEDTSHRRLKAIFESYLDGTAIIGNVGNSQKQ